MCLRGHHQDGHIYGRGQRRTCTEPGLTQGEGQSKKPRVMLAGEQPEELPTQPEVTGCAPEDEYIDVDEAANVEAGMLVKFAPVVGPEDILAASKALSFEIIADLPACAVIKGVDIVECQRCDQPTARSRLHNQG